MMYAYKVEDESGVLVRGFEFRLNKAHEIVNKIMKEAADQDRTYFKSEIVGLFNGYRSTLTISN
jgi:hypothetical protein